MTLWSGWMREVWMPDGSLALVPSGMELAKTWYVQPSAEVVSQELTR